MPKPYKLQMPALFPLGPRLLNMTAARMFAFESGASRFSIDFRRTGRSIFAPRSAGISTSATRTARFNGSRASPI